MNKKGCIFGIVYLLVAFTLVGAIARVVSANSNAIPALGFFHQILLVLALLMGLCLLLGLVAPQIFSRPLQDKLPQTSKLFGGKASRRHVGYVFGTVFVLFVMLHDATSAPEEKAEREKRLALAQQAQEAEADKKEIAQTQLENQVQTAKRQKEKERNAKERVKVAEARAQKAEKRAAKIEASIEALNQAKRTATLNASKKPSKEQPVTPDETKDEQQAVWDIPSLLGKSSSEVELQIGKPSYTEPDQTYSIWDTPSEFKMKGAPSLFVGYSSETGIVDTVQIDFVPEQDSPENRKRALGFGNLTRGDSRYSLEFGEMKGKGMSRIRVTPK